MANTKDNRLEYDYCLSKFKKTGDREWSDKIMDMILSGKAKVTVFEDEIFYKEAARFKNKCIKCGVYIKPGEPHFFQYSQNWHAACATEAEKSNSPYYQKIQRAKDTQ